MLLRLQKQMLLVVIGLYQVMDNFGIRDILVEVIGIRMSQIYTGLIRFPVLTALGS
jgi:hypothetical protein